MNTMKKLMVVAFLLVASSAWAVGSTTIDIGSGDLKKVRFFATNTTADQALPNGATTSASFTTVIIDNFNGWNGTATYTVQVAGFYEIVFTADITISSTSNNCYIFVNGSTKMRNTVTGSGSNSSQVVTYLLPLKVGDTISCAVAANGTGGNLYSSFGSSLKITQQ